MSFCTKTDFVGDVNLPAELLNSDKFDALLPKYEKTVLVKLLGFDLYYAFISGLEGQTVEQKWTDLEDGKVYQGKNDEGVTVNKEYSGMVELLKYFVCFFMLGELQSSATITGEVQANNENSVVVSPAPRLSAIWTDGVEEVLKCKDFIDCMNYADENTYPNFEFSDSYFAKMNVFQI